MSQSTIPGLANQPTPALTDLLEISQNPGSFNISLSQLSDFYQLLSLKNVANGYAGLDGSTKILVAQIPTAIPAINIADGSVDNTEFQRLNGLTSAIEEQGNKGAVSGYAGLDASQELLLANFPSGSALQVLRRDAANTALEFFTISDLQGITSINSDTTAAQIIAGTAGRISLVDAGATHTFDIDSSYVGQTSITTLGTITTGIWNGTDILFANIQDITTARLLGRQTAASGIIEEISLNTTLELVATTTLQRAALTGDVTAASGSNATTVANVPDGALSSNVVLINQANVFDDFTQTFKDNSIVIESPDGLTPVTLVNSQQTLARNLTIPILTANRNFVVTGEPSQIVIGTEVTGASTALTDTADLARNTDTLAFFAATTSLELFGVISDETGSGSLVFGTSPTLGTPFIGDFTNATHDHTNAAGGGQLLSTAALSDTANIAYLNTTNSYTAGVRQDFLGLLAGTAGLNVGGIAGNPTTQVDGDVWYNSTSNILFGRINGADVDLGASGGGEVFTWTNNHSMATFFLTADAGNNVILNAPTGQGVEIQVNAVQEYLFDATQADWNGNNLTGVGTLTITSQLNLSSANSLVWGGNNDRRLRNLTTGFEFEVETGDDFKYIINNVTEYSFNATQADFNGNNLTGVGNLTMTADINLGDGRAIIIAGSANRRIIFSSSAMTFKVETGDTYQYEIQGVTEYSYSATQADFNSNNIINLGTLNTHTIPSGTSTFALLGVSQTFTEAQTIATSDATDLTLTPPSAPTGSASTFIANLSSPAGTIAFITDPQIGNFFGTNLAIQTLTNPSAGTIPEAATLRIEGAPLASTNVTITDNAALHVAAGLSRFDGRMRIPFANPPTISVNGDLGIDSTVTDFSHGIMEYFATEVLGIVAMPIAQFTTPTDGDVVAYNAANDEFELVTPSGSPNAVLNNQANTYTGGGTQDFGSSNVILGGRLQEDKGADIASADAITLGGDGNTFIITGTTTMNHMINTNWQTGSKVTLLFPVTGGITITSSAGGSTGAEADFFLEADSDFSVTAGATLSLVYEGVSNLWIEIGRSTGV